MNISVGDINSKLQKCKEFISSLSEEIEYYKKMIHLIENDVPIEDMISEKIIINRYIIKELENINLFEFSARYRTKIEDDLHSNWERDCYYFINREIYNIYENIKNIKRY